MNKITNDAFFSFSGIKLERNFFYKSQFSLSLSQFVIEWYNTYSWGGENYYIIYVR